MIQQLDWQDQLACKHIWCFKQKWIQTGLLSRYICQESLPFVNPNFIYMESRTNWPIQTGVIIQKHSSDLDLWIFKTDTECHIHRWAKNHPNIKYYIFKSSQFWSNATIQLLLQNLNTCIWFSQLREIEIYIQSSWNFYKGNFWTLI